MVLGFEPARRELMRRLPPPLFQVRRASLLIHRHQVWRALGAVVRSLFVRPHRSAMRAELETTGLANANVTVVATLVIHDD